MWRGKILDKISRVVDAEIGIRRTTGCRSQRNYTKCYKVKQSM
jgi:hypothetical protein